jgi:hypothetical protein
MIVVFYFLVRDRCGKFLHNYELTAVHVNRTFELKELVK